jgi:hypothetical protein
MTGASTSFGDEPDLPLFYLCYQFGNIKIGRNGHAFEEHVEPLGDRSGYIGMDESCEQVLGRL